MRSLYILGYFEVQQLGARNMCSMLHYVGLSWSSLVFVVKPLHRRGCWVLERHATGETDARQLGRCQIARLLGRVDAKLLGRLMLGKDTFDLAKKPLNFGEKSVRVLPTELVLFCNCKSLVKVFLEAKVNACTSWVSGCLLSLAGNCCGLSKQNLTPVWV